MCLAVSGRIKNIQDGYADIDFSGLSKRASIRLFPKAKVGDYVLVHAGFVIQILDPEAGEELEGLITEAMGFVD